MGRHVVLTEKGSEDLLEIAVRIAETDASLAELYCNQLLDQTLILSDFPRMGRIVPELKNPVIRELIRSPYRIIYRINGEENLIQILRFWHSARGTPSL
jgi:plasmid stabilization system protein ParE